MVVCRYFVQGYCRYGDRCRFEHDNSNYDHDNREWRKPYESPSYTSPRYSTYSWPDKPAKTTTDKEQFSDKDIIELVNTDMDEWSNSHQWLFSVYAPTKEADNFPGFMDISPEEVRYEAYNVMQSHTGSLDAYKAKYARLKEDIYLQCKTLKKPSKEMLAILRKLLCKEKLNDVGAFSKTSSGTHAGLHSSNSSTFKFQLPSSNPTTNTFNVQLPSSSPTTFQFKLPSTGASMLTNTNTISSSNFFTGENVNVNAENNSENQMHYSTGEEIPPTQSNLFSFKLPTTEKSPLHGQIVSVKPVSTVVTKSLNLTSKPSTATSVYSSLVDLTDGEKHHFESSFFILGKIPEKSPPLDYCKQIR